jgi:hypothetical protein
VSATFIYHNQLESLIVVFPFTILSVLLCFISRARKKIVKISKKEFYALALAFVFVGITIFPIIYEELTSEYGNISRIIDLSTNIFSEHSHSLAETSQFVLDYFIKPLSWLNIDNKLLFFNLVFLLCLVNIIPNFLKNRKEYYFLAYCLLFATLGVLISIFLTVYTPGRLRFYMFMFNTVFVAIIYALAFIGFSRILDLTLKNWKRASLVKFCVYVFILALLSYYFIKTYENIRVLEVSPAVIEYCASPDAIINFISPEKNLAYEIILLTNTSHSSQWKVVTGVVLKLVRQGYEFCVPENLFLVFGEKPCPESGVRSIVFYTKEFYNGTRADFIYEDTVLEIY